MISSVKETHQHIINLRQVPPPVTEMGLTPSPQYTRQNDQHASLSGDLPASLVNVERSPGSTQSHVNRGGSSVGIPIASLNRFACPYPSPHAGVSYKHPTPESQWLGNPRYPPPPIPYSNHGEKKIENHATDSSVYVDPTPYYNHWNGPTVPMPVPRGMQNRSTRGNTWISNTPHPSSSHSIPPFHHDADKKGKMGSVETYQDRHITNHSEDKKNDEEVARISRTVHMIEDEDSDYEDDYVVHDVRLIKFYFM